MNQTMEFDLVKAMEFDLKDLSYLGIKEPGECFWNLERDDLYEHAQNNGEAKLTKHKALITTTGKHTGRSANDKFIVDDEVSHDLVDWGKVNKPFEEAKYFAIREKLMAHLKGRKLYVQDTIAGADRKNSIGVRVISEKAWHSLFMRNMLEAVNSESAKSAGIKPEEFVADYTIIDVPSFKTDPGRDGTRSETTILVNFKEKEVLIMNTEYAGEMKKSAFGILNFLLPQKGIMPMHCSANTDKDGNVAIFFGLSGTGKTTLSAEPNRLLIGDDEHGWSEEGVFNFEAGCYAKSIGLTLETEPEIYNASRMYGATIENVAMKEDGELDYFDTSLTENGRISYPVDFIPNAQPDRFVNKQPKNVIMLTCDAFGVLPAVSKLDPHQAREYFLAGYTAKVAGTEIGIKEPTAAFSPCFGAPFMALRPRVYGDLLSKKIAENNVDVWLVNTGWAGGTYGTGERMSIKLTRSIISKIHGGSLAKEKTRTHEIFGLEVPESIEMPEDSWADKAGYEETAKKLKGMFEEQFLKQETHFGVS